MKSLRFLAFMLVAASLIFLGSKFVWQNTGSISPQIVSIEGTYKFIFRKYADGKIVKPPKVIGFLTYTKDYRVFNFMWIDSSDKHNSESIVSKYKLSDKEYTETYLYSAAYHEKDLNDKNNGVTFGMNHTEPVPVIIKGTIISFKDVFSGLTLIFNGNKFTAVVKGMFTDYWVKVK